MSKIRNDRLNPVRRRMLHSSCTHMATVGVTQRNISLAGRCVEWSLCRGTVPPVIEPTLLSEYVVKEGSTLRVVCEATGVPPPLIVWRRAVTSHNLTDDPLFSDLVRTTLYSMITMLILLMIILLSQ